MVDVHNLTTVSAELQEKVIDINATIPVVQTGGSGKVNDVMVNNVSVVSDKVAYITLPENLDSRLETLESKAYAEVAAKISGSVSLSKYNFYAGYPLTIKATGTITLPSEVSEDYIYSIGLSGNGVSQSGSGKTVEIASTQVSDTTTFTLSGSIKSPYTKTVSATATITKRCPIYIGLVDTDVDTVDEVVSTIGNSTYLYSAESPISSIKSITNKAFTYGENQRLAFICGDSGVKIKEVGALANDAYTATGSTTINGITAYVYVSGTQQAGTRNMTFNA